MVKEDIHIIIVDDNFQFRSDLRYFVETELKCQVIGEASNGIELLPLLKNTTPDLILMDIVMDKMGGYETAKRILFQDSHLKIIAITMYSEIAYLVDLIKVGFRGCVFKHNMYDELPLALEVVKNGKLYFPGNILLDEKG